MSFLKNMFTNGRGIAAATNIHLAELSLPTLSAEDKRIIKNQMIEMWQRNTGQEIESRVRDFNKYTHMEQLNYLAMAMHYGGIASPVRGVEWQQISHPGVDLPDDKDISANASFFRQKYGVTVSIKTGSINITDW